ncbi:hypothetical protein DWZ53_05060, partial [Coprobacillus sp. AF33-1AC]
TNFKKTVDSQFVNSLREIVKTISLFFAHLFPWKYEYRHKSINNIQYFIMKKLTKILLNIRYTKTLKFCPFVQVTNFKFNKL